MSKTTTLYPVIVALDLGLSFGQATSGYKPTNDLQTVALEKYFPHVKDQHLFQGSELKCIANNDAEVINSFLKENGFSIKLEPFEDPSDFGTACIMEVLVKWETPGREADLLDTEGKVFPGALLEDGVTFTRSPNHPHPIAHIQCENGDMAHLTIADKAYDGFDLEQRIRAISQDGEECDDFDGLHFPMVDLDQEVDISYYKEMYFFGVSNVTGESGRYRITQAKQQTKYKMNHKGALAKSAATFGFSFECLCVRTPKPPMVVNQEFFVWITRPGMNLPIFTGYITKEDWKNPGDLTDNDMRHEGTTDEELAETEGNPEVLCSGDYLDK